MSSSGSRGFGSGGREFLFRKSDKTYGRVYTDEDYGDTEVDEDLEIPKNDELQKQAYKSGYNNIHRLADRADEDDEHLGHEIDGLMALQEQQVTGLEDVYGESGTDIAKEWKRRGTILADTGNDRNYRSRASVSFPSLEDSDNEIDIHGWDETIQTAITRERVRGRRAALAELGDHDQYAQLAQIHELMTQSSSLSRVPTAGVAGSLDSFEGSFGAHTTEKEYSAGGVGTNPMGHRDRTTYMQKAESALISSDDSVSMADIQRTRLESTLSYTANVMSARSVANRTNKDVFSRALNPSRKAAAMHYGREATKTMQRNIASDTLISPPSPAISHTSAKQTFAEYDF